MIQSKIFANRYSSTAFEKWKTTFFIARIMRDADPIVFYARNQPIDDDFFYFLLHCWIWAL